MKINLVKKNSRSAVVQLAGGGKYQLDREYDVLLNDEVVQKTDRVVVPLFGLVPDTAYVVQIGGESLSFRTDKEFVTLCVRDFGAKGDGVNDDTVFIQAAIMACPKESRVLIPAGDYLVSSLFLISDIKIELQKGARLVMNKERFSHPIMPGMLESWDEKSEYNIGTWEGNPLSMFAACISGFGVKNVEIYGEGVIDGNTTHDDWWHDPKTKVGAWRPRLLFLNNCENISVFGPTFMNSPSWNIHPYYSRNIEFIALRVQNPMDSPNTDGIDVEACSDVKILGVHLTLGDDCIALKSCKIYMAKKYEVTCQNITIQHCLMESGHGAITVGSEIAGGVKHARVENCFFKNTDRGLRIKTRRGRGRLAVVDDVEFRNIEMDGVQTPFVANSLYFCDPDGKSDYVQSRAPLPVDERTPHIKKLHFEDVVCKNAHIAAAYFIGLPEKKIDEIIMKNIKISFAENAMSGDAAMHCGIEKMCKHGIYAAYVDRLVLDNVEVIGNVGEDLVTDGVERVERV